MSLSDIDRNTTKDILVPLLLDSDRALSIASVLYKRYGASSYVISNHFSMSVFLYPHTKRLRTPKISNPELLYSFLEMYAGEYSQEKILLLIGCSDRADDFIVKNRSRLEAIYAVRTSVEASADRKEIFW